MEESINNREYDVIVLGTGVRISILASALALKGKSILQLDSKPYYGGLEASWNLMQWLEFLIKEKDSLNELGPIQNVKMDLHIKKTTEVDENDQPESLDFENIASLLDDTNSNELRNLLEILFNKYQSSKNWNIEEWKYLLSYLKESRGYQIELFRPFMLANSDLIQWILKAKVQEYFSLKLMSKSLLFSDGEFKEVPLSKESIFANKTLSLIDKRKLMRFLKFIMELDIEDNEAINEISSQFSTLTNLLREKFTLSKSLIDTIHYTINCSIIDSDSANLEISLRVLKTFMASYGRYGPHFMLYFMYGGGSELSQAFCRLCAVHQGTYILNQDITPINLQDDQNESKFLVETKDYGSFKSPFLVLDIDHMPEQLRSYINIKSYTYKMIVIVEGELLPENMDIQHLVIPPGESEIGNISPIHTIALGSGAKAIPNGKTLLHLSITFESSKEAISITQMLNKAKMYLFSYLNTDPSTNHITFTFTQFERGLDPSWDKPKNLIVSEDPKSCLWFDTQLDDTQAQFNLASDGNLFDN